MKDTGATNIIGGPKEISAGRYKGNETSRSVCC